MRSRRTPSEQEAVARRLELLSAELTAVRDEGERVADHDPLSVEPVPGWAPETHTRVRLDESAEDGPREPQVEEAPPAPLPAPGRHAARRTREGPAARLVPPTLQGRVALGPGQLAVVAVAIAIGLAVTAWWVVRADPDPRPVSASPSPAAGLVESPDGSPSAGAGAAAGEEGEVVVDVAGKVREPGVTTLPTGSRVVDALEAAGGARKGVDLTGLNLARPLVDGEQVLVGVDPPPGSPAGRPAAAGAGSASGGEQVSINSADQAALEELPGVGPVTATAILDWRAEHGGFSSVEELLEVNGIGEATLDELRPHVTP